MMNKDYAIVVKPRIEISSIDITEDGKYGFLVTPDLFLLGFEYDENGKPKKGTIRMSMGFPNDKRKNNA